MVGRELDDGELKELVSKGRVEIYHSGERFEGKFSEGDDGGYRFISFSNGEMILEHRGIFPSGAHPEDEDGVVRVLWRRSGGYELEGLGATHYHSNRDQESNYFELREFLED
jgi:hypothetical protein